MTFAGSIAAGLVSASSGIYDTLLLCRQDRFSLLAYDGVSPRAPACHVGVVDEPASEL